MRSHCGSDVEVMRNELTHFTALRGIDYCRFSMRKNIQYVSLVPFYFYVFLSFLLTRIIKRDGGGVGFENTSTHFCRNENR